MVEGEEERLILRKTEKALQFAYKLVRRQKIYSKQLGFRLQDWERLMNSALRGWERFAELRESLESDEDEDKYRRVKQLVIDCETLLDTLDFVGASGVDLRAARQRLRSVSWKRIMTLNPGRVLFSMLEDYTKLLLRIYNIQQKLVDGISNVLIQERPVRRGRKRRYNANQA